MAIIKTVGVWLARIGSGCALIWLMLAWVEYQTGKREAAARAEGKAICEAEQARKEIKKLNQKMENKKNVELKKNAVWAAPSLDDDAILRLFDSNQL